MTVFELSAMQPFYWVQVRSDGATRVDQALADLAGMEAQARSEGEARIAKLQVELVTHPPSEAGLKVWPLL